MRIITLLFLIYGYQCRACGCIGKDPINIAVKKTDVIFVAKVIARSRIAIYDSTSNIPIYYYAQILIISKKYKGDFIQDTINIITGLGNGDCGLNFKIGKRYIIYGKYKKYSANITYLYTDICTRTQRNNFKECRKIKKFLK